MDYRIEKDKIVVRLDKDEDIISSLHDIAIKENIRGGSFTGIGAANFLKIGIFDPVLKQYVIQEFKGDFEIVNLTGNFGYFENKPVVHAHISFASSDFKVKGGHLLNGTVSLTCEIFGQILTNDLIKLNDNELGIKRIKI